MAAHTEFSIDDLLRRAHELEASDLHVTPGSEPVVRIRGRIERLSEFEKLSADVTRELIYRILSTKQQKTLETKRSSTSRTPLPGVARFRVNAFFQRETHRRGVPHDPDARSSRSRSSACPEARRARQQAARPRARHRPDRLRQVDDARRDDRPDQPHARASTSSRSRIRSSSSTSTATASSTSARSATTRRRSPRRCAPRCARTPT